MNRIIISTSLLAALMLASPAQAYDDLRKPPADPSGTARAPLTESGIQHELDQRLMQRFKAAAGSSPRLTRQQAKDANWGFIADHFAEIDTAGAGYVSFDQIQTFMDARSIGATAKARVKARESTVETIE
ncbi:hypothetical protein SAMN04515648_1104 [Phyllobacterium sp. CL33Tsu]|uniref:hypothetical protein n=1 Tax=Phyllobacterium sp. CL33Tsu TaxID=1798191 RepID=UPI0008EA1D6A|nr:hypothetical protein [Phyllobacterium sp. CL33Tsu]SFI67317.1 hypothetical protein SAMN04515648_1104 [Phyllobacterium sp. CL33Tsu]